MSKKLTKDEFIERANKIHNFKYDYSKIEYIDSHTKICIICPKHGEFTQKPYKHLQGQGCITCARELDSINKKKNNEYYIQKFTDKHKNKYDYSLINCNGSKNKVKIICPIHGEFEQTIENHLEGKGCPKCGHIISKQELEILNIIKSYNINVETNVKLPFLDNKELDIFIPSKNIAIEYNGLRWHTEEYGRDKNYHLNKTLKCNENNIKLIQIFEDEFIYHSDIVINKLLHILQIQHNTEKIGGRNCKIKEINSNIAKEFLNKYHIQGYSRSTTYLGAFYGTLLVAVMTFTLNDKKSLKWELNRFASDYHYVCQGVGGKLFKYFITHFDYEEIKSFADRRWTVNIYDNLYIKLGFVLDKILKPDYRYVNLNYSNKERLHKFNFRKDRLNKKYNFSQNMTENEIIKELGYSKIWDCGLIKYVYKKMNK